MSQSSDREEVRAHGREEPGPIQRTGISRAGRLLFLVPAVIAVVAVAAPIPSHVASVLLVGTLLVAPGFLLWSLIPSPPVFRDAFALPALVVVASITLNMPAALVGLLGGLHSSRVVLIWILQLLALGLLAVTRGNLATNWPATPWRFIVPAVVGGAAVLAMALFYWTGDNLSYEAFIEVTRDTGHHPTTSPYLAGDLDLPARWRIAGWVAMLGSLAHATDASGSYLLERVLPPLLLIAGASAAYFLARILTHRVDFASAAAVVATLLPLADNPGKGGSLYLAWYRANPQDKYVMLLIMLPVALGLLLLVLEHSTRWIIVAAAAVVVTSVFVHAFSYVLLVPLLAGYVVLRTLQGSRSELRRAWAAGVTLLPAVLVALTFVVAMPTPFGARPHDAESVEGFAAKQSFGPLTVYEGPISINGNQVDLNDDAAVASYFIAGHLALGEPTRLIFLSRDIYVPNPALLVAPLTMLTAIAALLMLGFDRRARLTAWVVASLLIVGTVFLVPGIANAASLAVPPWQLWRFSWMIPSTLALTWLVYEWPRRVRLRWVAVAPVFVLLLWAAASIPHEGAFDTRRSDLYVERSDLNALTEKVRHLQGTVVAPRTVSDTIARLPDVRVLTYRGRSTMSNNFPSADRADSLNRKRDNDAFIFHKATAERQLAVLEEWNVDYVIIDPNEVPTTDLPLEPIRRLPGGFWLYKVDSLA